MHEHARLAPAPEVALGSSQPPVADLQVEEAGGEAAQMREVRHTVARGEQCEHERDRHEERHEPFGRNRRGEEQHVDRGVRRRPRERQQHAVHGGRRADHRIDPAEAPPQHQRQDGPSQSAEQVVAHERPATHPLLHFGTEDVQREQVESEVQQVGVDEHVRDKRPRLPESVERREPERTDEPRADGQRHLEQANVVPSFAVMISSDIRGWYLHSYSTSSCFGMTSPTGTGTSPTTPTVISRPGINCSAITALSNAFATSTAASNPSALRTSVIPTEEPIFDGLTITGHPSAVVTSSGATGAMNHAGTGTPAARNSRLARSLSMASALASAPLPV